MPPARRLLPLLLALILVGTALGGCARVRTALALQPDDTVTGEIVLATPERDPDDTGPLIGVPANLKSDVDVSGYRQDGYAGSVLRFDSLTFDEVPQLIQAVGPGAGAVQFQLRRAGNRVQVSGRVDLKTVSVDRADFQLKISFPGDVLDTDGDDDAGTVSWNFTRARSVTSTPSSPTTTRTHPPRSTGRSGSACWWPWPRPAPSGTPGGPATRRSSRPSADHPAQAAGHRLGVPGHHVGDSRLIGGSPPSALWRRQVL